MPTPNSSATAYCTPAQLLNFHDARQIGDALSDLGVRVQANQIATDPNVLAALSWASGMVESACFVADRYSAADLQALTGQSAVLLQGLVADLAWWKLKDRRGASAQQVSTPGDLAAWKMLDDLRAGTAIFGLQEKGDAGNPDTEFMTLPQFQIDQLSTGQAERFFGTRAAIARTGAGTGLPSG